METSSATTATAKSTGSLPLAAVMPPAGATEGVTMSFAYEPGAGDTGGAFIGLGGRLYGASIIIR